MISVDQNICVINLGIKILYLEACFLFTTLVTRNREINFDKYIFSGLHLDLEIDSLVLNYSEIKLKTILHQFIKKKVI